jgi:hypothetical protein
MTRFWPFRHLGLKVLSVGLAVILWLIAPVERRLAGMSVHLRNLGPDLTARATPSTVAVLLQGSRQSLVGLSPDDVDVFVDLAGLGAGDYLLGVSTGRAERGGVLRTEPAAVQVQITSAQP